MDTITSMQVFVATVESGTLCVAARRLHISAASVTKNIQALESRLQVRLLNRTTRQIHLTEAGELYFHRCRAVLEKFAAAEAAMAKVSGSVGGSLRIAADGGFAASELFPVVSAFIDQYPGLETDLVACASPPDLLRDRFDLGVHVMADQPDSSLIARKIACVRRVICAAPSYLDRLGRPAHPGDLAGQRFLLPSEASPVEQCLLRRGAEEQRVCVMPVLRSNDADILHTAALDGRGLLLLPSYCVWRSVEQGRLELVLPDWTVGELGIYVVYPSRSFLPQKTRLFIDALTRHFSGALYDDIWLARLASRGSMAPAKVAPFRSGRTRGEAVAV